MAFVSPGRAIAPREVSRRLGKPMVVSGRDRFSVAPSSLRRLTLTFRLFPTPQLNMKKPTFPRVPYPLAPQGKRRPVKRRRPIEKHCEPLGKKLVSTSLLNLGFLLLAFRPMPQEMLQATLPQEEASALPTVEIPRVQAVVARHAQTSLQQVDRIWDNTQAQIQLEQNPPIVYHVAPEAFRGQTVYDVPLPSQDRVVALTFDDGPWSNTPEILDILRKHNAHATFFVIGRHAENNPDLLRRIVAEGHTLGNHSWNHRYHPVGTAEAMQEIDRTSEFIYEVTGVHTRFFRPPGGNLTNGLAAHAAGQDYAVMMWSLDSLDYAVSVPEIVSNVVDRAAPGAVILLHDGGGNRARTVAALPQILDRLEAEGYRFVTLPEMMELSVSRRQKSQ
ncbi:polysaccharide deacetylase family protein [Baaleninema sp.]|uniref:polysaccharide deacetylase family protein n=1 Tax=Baaleninema sp. TaxID=3101197 RepID=UPI003D078334